MKSISISNFDTAKVDEVFSVISEVESTPGDSPKKLLLKLKNTTGDVLLAIGIATRLLNSKVDLHIVAEGIINPAGTIIAAAGVPGGRTASFTTVFQLTKSGKKIGRRGPKENDDKLLFALLAKYTSKKSAILSLMQLSGSITSKEAESLGIIDDVSDFRDKYAAIKEAKKKNKRLKKLEAAANSPSDNSNSTSESSKKPQVDKKLLEDVDKHIKTLEEEAGK